MLLFFFYLELSYLIFLLFLSIDCSSQDSSYWKLITVDLKKYPLATCLDGSPGGFWFQEGIGKGKENYLIHHQGGAWCTNHNECIQRSQTILGSSKQWKKEMNCSTDSFLYSCWINEPTPTHPSKNPITAYWNKIFVGSCDGSSLSGRIKDAVNITTEDGKQSIRLYYRGNYILEAIYDIFITRYNLTKAKEIMISGGSAGALVVYLHSNYLIDLLQRARLRMKIPSSSSSRSSLPSSSSSSSSLQEEEQRISIVMDGGIYLNIPSITGEYLYPKKFQELFYLQNLSASLDRDCLEFYSNIYYDSETKNKTDERWKCLFAQYMIPFLDVKDIFIVNSLMDKWSGEFIMGIRNCIPTDKIPSLSSSSSSSRGGNSKSAVAASLGPCSKEINNYVLKHRIAMLQEAGIQSYINCSTAPSCFNSRYYQQLLLQQQQEQQLIQLHRHQHRRRSHQTDVHHGAWLFGQWHHTVFHESTYWNQVKVEGYTLSEVFSHWYQRNYSVPWIVIDEPLDLKPPHAK